MSKRITISTFPPAGDELKAFIRFGIDYRKQFPYLLPVFKKQEFTHFDPVENHFFREGGLCVCFLARENDTIRGRIAAMINPLIPFEKGKLGLVGFFDVEDDFSVAEALFTVAKDWLREQNCTDMWGPVDFSIWHRYRLAFNQFEAPPYVGEPKNPPHYPEFFTRFGFSVLEEYVSHIAPRDQVRKLLPVFAGHYENALHAGYKIENFKKKYRRQYFEAIYEILQHTIDDFRGYYPLAKKEFQKLFEILSHFLDRKSTTFLYNPDGKIVAFCIILKDMEKAMQAMDGKTNLFSKLKFKWHENENWLANVYLGALLPNENQKAKAIAAEMEIPGFAPSLAVMFRVIDQILKQKNYQKIMIALMRPEARPKNYFRGIEYEERRYKLYGMEL